MPEITLLRGGPSAKLIKEKVSNEVAALREQGINACMSVVLATDDPSALSYANSKQKTAETLGIDLRVVNIGADATQSELESLLSALSADPQVHGILLEFPLRPQFNTLRALMCIDPKKDVDGLTPYNMGLVIAGDETQALISATAQACTELAEAATTLSGKNVGLVGRGRTVGRPLIGMLVNRHATVTICHTRTTDLAAVLSRCEVVIVAIGKPQQIRGEDLREGQIIIDAGINVIGDSLVGDVDFDSVVTKAAAITPVPGGVGPLTSAIIFRNLMKAIRLQHSFNE